MIAATVGSYAALLRSRYYLRIFAIIAALVIIFEVIGGVVTFTWIGDRDATYLDKLSAGVSYGIALKGTSSVQEGSYAPIGL